MKLLLKFAGLESKAVTWEGEDIFFFPHTLSYKNEYYQWFMWDAVRSSDIDYELNFSRIGVHQLPHDGWGNVIPVDSIERMFGTEKECDCGAKKAGTTHAHWCSKGN